MAKAPKHTHAHTLSFAQTHWMFIESLVKGAHQSLHKCWNKKFKMKMMLWQRRLRSVYANARFIESKWQIKHLFQEIKNNWNGNNDKENVDIFKEEEIFLYNMLVVCNNYD